jgi:hypothetical protein
VEGYCGSQGRTIAWTESDESAKWLYFKWVAGALRSRILARFRRVLRFAVGADQLTGRLSGIGSHSVKATLAKFNIMEVFEEPPETIIPHLVGCSQAGGHLFAVLSN